jgi:hypothetical protein
MARNIDLQDVKILYTRLGINQKLSGARGVFDKSDFREVIRDRVKNPIASLEVKMINRDDGIMNFIFLPRHENAQTTEALVDSAVNRLSPKFLYIPVHLADSKMQEICMLLNFKLITDRNILVRNKLPVDGVHLSYMQRFR